MKSKNMHWYNLPMCFDDSTLEFLGLYADSLNITFYAVLREIFYTAIADARRRYERELLDKLDKASTN